MARIPYPDLPEETIGRIAAAIIDASPSGDPWQIRELQAMLETAGSPIASYVKSMRYVAAIATEWTG